MYLNQWSLSLQLSLWMLEVNSVGNFFIYYDGLKKSVWYSSSYWSQDTPPVSQLRVCLWHYVFLMNRPIVVLFWLQIGTHTTFFYCQLQWALFSCVSIYRRWNLQYHHSLHIYKAQGESDPNYTLLKFSHYCYMFSTCLSNLGGHQLQLHSPFRLSILTYPTVQPQNPT